MQRHEYSGEGGNPYPHRNPNPKNADEVGRLVETPALASVEGSTQKVYWSKWQTWCCMRAIEGKNPWLAEKDGVDAAVKALTNFMSRR